MQSQIEQRKLDLSNHLEAGLEDARSAQLFEGIRRQRIAGCADIIVTTSGSQAKFSMNWLGSSTASHGTPLMPETLG